MADNEGEAIVNTLLKQHFKKVPNRLYSDITLPINNSGSTQIDHILINQYGIFVIETKHYSGWIFGTESNVQWTQTFPSAAKFSFQNPIIQNKYHIRQLRQYLPALPESVFKSIVVFTGTAEFKTKSIRNVIRADKLVKYLSQFNEKILTTATVEAVAETIESKRKAQSAKTDAAHIDYVQNKLKKSAHLTSLSSNRASSKMNNFAKEISFFLLKIIIALIIGYFILMKIPEVLKNMGDDFVSRSKPHPNPVSTLPLPVQPPILDTEPAPPVIQPPQITKSTSSHRVGSICNTKKCIYQVEIVETSCYSATNTCTVTRKDKGTETVIFADENKPH